MEVLATKFDAAVVGRNNRAVTLHGMVHALRDLGGVDRKSTRLNSSH